MIRASRIAAAGHGGQVLLSSTAAPFVTEIETRDLGTHRLQGLPDPERIHQVLAEGLPRDFPPLRGTVSQLGDARRVVLADDSVLLREGVARLLEEAGFEVVAQSGTADDLLRHVAMHKPDVAVVDIRMPPTHTDEGLRAAREIRERHPGRRRPRSSRSTSSRATRWRCSRRAPRASATSSRTASPTSSSSARPCAASPTAAPRSTRRSSASSSGASGATTRSSSSPPREREVLELMAEGRSNQAIAERLFVTLRAVEKHVTSIFTKLGLPGVARTTTAACSPCSPTSAR